MSIMQRIGFSLFCLCPIAVVLTSLITGLINPVDRPFGLWFAIVGLLFGILNLYLALIRPAVYIQKHQSLDGFRYISGFPIIGTFFVVLGCIFSFAHIPTAIVGVLAILGDINGLPWVLALVWRKNDQSEREP